MADAGNDKKSSQHGRPQSRSKLNASGFQVVKVYTSQEKLGKRCMYWYLDKNMAVADPAMGPPFFSYQNINIHYIIVFTHSFVNIIDAGNDAVDHCLLWSTA